MLPAEHRTVASKLVDSLDIGSATPDQVLSAAQVHATLALAPAPPPSAQPQQRVDIDRRATFTDAQGQLLNVWPTADKDAVILGNQGDYGDAWLIESPDTLRTLASLLTAHADRLESKP